MCALHVYEYPFLKVTSMEFDNYFLFYLCEYRYLSLDEFSKHIHTPYIFYIYMCRSLNTTSNTTCFRYKEDDRR